MHGERNRERERETGRRDTGNVNDSCAVDVKTIRGLDLAPRPSRRCPVLPSSTRPLESSPRILSLPPPPPPLPPPSLSRPLSTSIFASIYRVSRSHPERPNSRKNSFPEFETDYSLSLSHFFLPDIAREITERADLRVARIVLFFTVIAK